MNFRRHDLQPWRYICKSNNYLLTFSKSSHVYACLLSEIICYGYIGPSPPRFLLSIMGESSNGVELNWLPPTEPNGKVHYAIYYTPEGGIEQSIDTGSNLTHYNLTGLERNRVYTNIAVQAVNSVGRSARSDVIAPHGELCEMRQLHCTITHHLVSKSL